MKKEGAIQSLWMQKMRQMMKSRTASKIFVVFSKTRWEITCSLFATLLRMLQSSLHGISQDVVICCHTISHPGFSLCPKSCRCSGCFTVLFSPHISTSRVSLSLKSRSYNTDDLLYFLSSAMEHTSDPVCFHSLKTAALVGLISRQT